MDAVPKTFAKGFRHTLFIHSADDNSTVAWHTEREPFRHKSGEHVNWFAEISLVERRVKQNESDLFWRGEAVY